ncbi:hypothetical protein ABZY03_17015 [Streptomyces klenkii]|uniref:hypothetical protein n=1 Tax=Streptomyces klenkii TaxID=1420899 RepID=UPI0033A09D53
MLGRTLLAVTALTAALVIPSAAPDADAAALAATTLINESDGRTLGLPVGQEIRVRLQAVRGNGERWTWSTPVVSATDVLNRTAGHTTPNGGAAADIRVAGTGRSHITAQRTCTPTRQGHQCRHASLEWRVTVDAH